MTLIDAAPKTTKHISLTVGTDDFAKHVNNVTCAPQPGQTLEWRGGHPDAVYTDQAPGTWQLSLTAIEDWETAASLCNFLLAHMGEEATIVYKPIFDGDAEFTIDVASLGAPTIGGPTNAFNEFTVTMPCSKPVKTTP